jgi:hypothetical protein
MIVINSKIGVRRKERKRRLNLTNKPGNFSEGKKKKQRKVAGPEV